MAQRVVWSARTLADVEAIAAYIASDSPSYANTVTRKIVTVAAIVHGKRVLENHRE
jgi:toxin ParE1/3/4